MALIRISQLSKPRRISLPTAVKILRAASVAVEPISSGRGSDGKKTHWGIGHTDVDKAEKLFDEHVRYRETPRDVGRPTNERLDRNACAELKEDLAAFEVEVFKLLNAQGMALSAVEAKLDKLIELWSK